ncbi:TlpA family protein disulfide reductase [Sinomicrobium weinanense]|uniref:TlpA family protein disulfide reductase n=1 Tax=Sinomicrobium weinanense TaxID=2842200 RepID=A0A926JQ60_9FLAO|nr:TlpA disulfide reductase family protein [Sinomicrobium weinanense]MBC9795284.1 TlpA family protein disulfide reductase [Sinomicrobium weinanense]MBU3125756.1 TlpA family protein disulfide reductase [Sinomicrobium weinanense]
MKISKQQMSNLALLLFAVLILFTPAGTTVKIWVNRLIAFSPSETPVEDRDNIGSYNWDLRSADGKIYDFNAARDKVVLVNFWATWCPPCLAEMPDMQRLYESYGNKVVFLFVTGEDMGEVKEFLGKKKWNLPVYTPMTRAPEKMYSSSIPATWILDKKGNMVVQKKGAADWDSDKVKALLDRLLQE